MCKKKNNDKKQNRIAERQQKFVITFDFIDPKGKSGYHSSRYIHVQIQSKYKGKYRKCTIYSIKSIIILLCKIKCLSGFKIKSSLRGYVQNYKKWNGLEFFILFCNILELHTVYFTVTSLWHYLVEKLMICLVSKLKGSHKNVLAWHHNEVIVRSWDRSLAVLRCQR